MTERLKANRLITTASGHPVAIDAFLYEWIATPPALGAQNGEC